MYCAKCGARVGESKFCPNCGANLADEKSQANNFTQEVGKTKKKKHIFLRVFVFAIIVFVAIIVVAAISSIGNAPNNMASTTNTSETITETDSSQSAAQGNADLEVIDYEAIVEGYSRYVTGHIKNNTDKSYSYVQVEINLYSGETQVGSTLDNVNNLGPGDTWEFKAPILDDSADSFRIVNVTGF